MKPSYWIPSLLVLLASAVVAQANRHDTNRDRRISWEEFAVAKQAEAEAAGREYNEAAIRILFGDKDRDMDESLTYQEFQTHPFDVNDDQRITFDEWTETMTRRGVRAGRPYTEEWIRNQFARRDQNGDGWVSYQELSRRLN